MAEKKKRKKINPVTGKPYPDISQDVYDRFSDDGYGIRSVEEPKKKQTKKKK